MWLVWAVEGEFLFSSERKWLQDSGQQMCIWMKGKMLQSQNRVWKEPDTADQNHQLKPTVKHGGGRLMIGACFEERGTGSGFPEGTNIFCSTANVWLKLGLQQMIPNRSWSFADWRKKKSVELWLEREKVDQNFSGMQSYMGGVGSTPHSASCPTFVPKTPGDMFVSLVQQLQLLSLVLSGMGWKQLKRLTLLLPASFSADLLQPVVLLTLD